MKQATLSAFSALDLRQTFNGSIISTAPPPPPPLPLNVVAETVEAASNQVVLVGNKSRARSCFGVSSSSSAAAAAAAALEQAAKTTSTFEPSNQTGRCRFKCLSSLKDTHHHHHLHHQSIKTTSERQTNNHLVVPNGESFEHRNNQDNYPPSLSNFEFIHQPNLEQQQYSATKKSNYDDCRIISKPKQLIPQQHQQQRETINQQQHQHQQQEEKMSQTIQSIQSLSMQLNRAASYSVTTLDDSMSVSQEMVSAGCQISSDSNSLAGGKKLSKLVGKKAGRMKEILLQNLGKAHRTTDELFEMYEENFYKQQAQAVKIQKEFKIYMSSLKGNQDAGKNLNLCIQQSTGVYQSARHDLVCENLSQLDILNEDLLDKLRGQIQVSLSEYMSQFSELREKIMKRKRKLIDYDSSRRVYEIMLANVQRKRQSLSQNQEEHNQAGLRSLRPSFMNRSSSGSSSTSSMRTPQSNVGGGSGDCIQSAASQLVDEARLLKLREQYNYCKLMFETINSELYQELPMIYEKKMKHLLMTLQNYFSLEAQFHSNAGKLFATASDVIDELPMSIHRSQQQNPLNHPLKQQMQKQEQVQMPMDKLNNGQSNNDNIASNSDNKNDNDEYINHIKASGSSGMGSSRGDSSLESSSSPENSINGSSSPNNDVDCSMIPVVSLHPASVSVSVATTSNTATATGDEKCIGTNNNNQLHPLEHEMKEETLENAVVKNDDKKLASKGMAPLIPSTSSVSNIGENNMDGCDISCDQLDSLSMDFGSSSVSESVGTIDSESITKQQQQQDVETAHDDDDNNNNDENNEHEDVDVDDDRDRDIEQQASTSEGSSCSVIEITKPEEFSADKLKTCSKEENENCLQKVRTSYKYLAEDVDELCFEADEIIQVIEFEENQEQEEGWLMGVREVNGQKGLFPANFTKPI